jgi:hypothetical protein
MAEWAEQRAGLELVRQAAAPELVLDGELLVDYDQLAAKPVDCEVTL